MYPQTKPYSTTVNHHPHQQQQHNHHQHHHPPKSRMFQIHSLFDGAIIASERAYVDVFLIEDVDLRNIALKSSQDQTYLYDVEEYLTTFRHEILYKGETVWRTEVPSFLLPQDEHGRYTSYCKISKGCLEVEIIRDQHHKSFLSSSSSNNEIPFILNPIKKRIYDLATIVRGAAVAYQTFATEEDIGQQYSDCRQYNDTLKIHKITHRQEQHNEEEGSSSSSRLFGNYNNNYNNNHNKMNHQHHNYNYHYQRRNEFQHQNQNQHQHQHQHPQQLQERNDYATLHPKTYQSQPFSGSLTSHQSQPFSGSSSNKISRYGGDYTFGHNKGSTGGRVEHDPWSEEESSVIIIPNRGSEESSVSSYQLSTYGDEDQEQREDPEPLSNTINNNNNNNNDDGNTNEDVVVIEPPTTTRVDKTSSTLDTESADIRAQTETVQPFFNFSNFFKLLIP